MAGHWSPTTKRVVALIALALAALFLVRANAVITPFVWAAVFAYVFGPVVGWAQRRTRLPRAPLVAGLFAVLALAVYAIGRLLIPVVADELRELQGTFPTLLNNVEDQLLTALAGTGYESVAVGVFDEASGLAQVLADHLLPVAVTVAESLLRVLVFVIALFYLLRDGPQLSASLRRVLPRPHREELLLLLGRINSVLGQYVRGQVILIAIMTTATTIGLSILQVPFSVLLGFITGILETIPIVGPITAGTFAVLVALGHPAPFGWTQVGYAGVVAVMYTVLRHVEDYLVVPYVIGRIVELHPLVVILALLAGGAIGGLLGILVAVPVAASLRLALLYTLAKMRDEDPYRVIEEPVPVNEEAVATSKRPA